jgi:hypothetical protein
MFVSPETLKAANSGIERETEKDTKLKNASRNEIPNWLTTFRDSVFDSKLQALSLVNDCYKYKMDLVTNGFVMTDAIKFVRQKKEYLSEVK